MCVALFYMYVVTWNKFLTQDRRLLLRNIFINKLSEAEKNKSCSYKKYRLSVANYLQWLGSEIKKIKMFCRSECQNLIRSDKRTSVKFFKAKMSDRSTNENVKFGKESMKFARFSFTFCFVSLPEPSQQWIYSEMRRHLLVYYITDTDNNCIN